MGIFGTRQADAKAAEKLAELEAMVARRSTASPQAVIEFQLDGTIITANENFLKTVGYSLAEVQGRSRSMFVDADYARSADL